MMLRRYLVPLILMFGCDSSRPVQTFEFDVQIFGDPGIPLDGASVESNGQVVGTSNEQGRLRLRGRGEEGKTLEFSVKCPEGYRSPSSPLAVTVRRLSKDARSPEYEVQCRPRRRKVVVAVRAPTFSDLPISYLGSEVARTDASGAAHVKLEAEPNEALLLTIDTSARPDLRPKNPSKRIVVGDRDELVVFDQQFVKKAKPRIRRAKPKGPIRID